MAELPITRQSATVEVDEIDFSQIKMFKNPDRKEIHVNFPQGVASTEPECEPYSCDAFADWNPADDTFEWVSVTTEVTGSQYVPETMGVWGLLDSFSNPIGPTWDWDEIYYYRGPVNLDGVTTAPVWCDIAGYTEPLGLSLKSPNSENGKLECNTGAFAATVRGSYFAIDPVLYGTPSGSVGANCSYSATEIKVIVANQTLTGARLSGDNTTWRYMSFSFDTIETPDPDNAGRVFKTLIGHFHVSGYTPINWSIDIGGNQTPSTSIKMNAFNQAEIDIADLFTGSAETLIDGELYFNRKFPNYQVPDTCVYPTKTSLVYNFEDDNYTWMDAAVLTSQSTAPECQPYACDAVKVFVESNSGWPMDDPEVNGGVYTGPYFNGGPAGLQLTLPAPVNTLGNFPVGGGWAGIYQYNATKYADFPDLCIEASDLVRVSGLTQNQSSIWLDGARSLAETTDVDFSSTHVRIGTGGGVTLEWVIQALTQTGGNYLCDARCSASVDATNVTLQFQNLSTLQTQQFPVGAFEYNKPYVVTTDLTVKEEDIDGRSSWTSIATFRITDANGLTFTHTFTEVSSGYSGAPAYANPDYPSYIILHRGGEVDSLGVVFEDVHSGAVLAVQQNYADYQTPEYCTVDGLYPIEMMEYGFEAGWATRWDTPEINELTWDDFNSAQAPWNESSAPRWSDMASEVEDRAMFWLENYGIWRADQVIYTGDLKEYFVERVNMNFDDITGWRSNTWKHIKQFYFHLQAYDSDTTFDIAAGWSKGLMDAPDYAPYDTIDLDKTVNQGRHKWDFRSTGRYLALKMDFSNTGRMTMTGGDMDAEEAHKR